MKVKETIIGLLIAGAGGVTSLFSAPVGTLIAVVGTAVIISNGLAD